MSYELLQRLIVSWFTEGFPLGHITSKIYAQLKILPPSIKHIMENPPPHAKGELILSTPLYSLMWY